MELKESTFGSRIKNCMTLNVEQFLSCDFQFVSIFIAVFKDQRFDKKTLNRQKFRVNKNINSFLIRISQSVYV